MPTRHDVQQVCLNGHQITASYNSSPSFRKNYCTECGERTIHQCPNCNNAIKGKAIYENIIAFDLTSVPDICEYCGKDFPWRQKKAKLIQAIQPQQKEPLILIDLICERFHLVAKQLRQRHADRPTLDISDEYDTQDLFHAILKIYFDDIRSEEWHPSYAGSSSRSDFLLKEEKLVIEIKKTRQSLKAKQLGEELIIDIAKYKNHPDCKLLYCFVYDPEGYINNPKGMQNDLSKDETDFKIIVNITPKGH